MHTCLSIYGINSKIQVHLIEACYIVLDISLLSQEVRTTLYFSQQLSEYQFALTLNNALYIFKHFNLYQSKQVKSEKCHFTIWTWDFSLWFKKYDTEYYLFSPGEVSVNDTKNSNDDSFKKCSFNTQVHVWYWSYKYKCYSLPLRNFSSMEEAYIMQIITI